MVLIENLLTEIGLLAKQFTPYSFLCISTTRPIYLVFGQKSAYPTYVIRKLDTLSATHANKIHQKLYDLVSTLVPEPIGVYEYSGSLYEVQRGVKGAPWFQIKSSIYTVEAQTNLEIRMWQTLYEFQSAIRSDATNAMNDLRPQEELSKAYTAYLSTSETGTKLNKLVERGIIALSLSKTCPKLPQHGDFCLNNLIIDVEKITVIDFEDFSITKMPLYDHFTLALSLPSYETNPATAANAYNHCNIIATAQTLGISESVIPWHFLHHLLLRLGPWSSSDKRITYRGWLQQVLTCFIEQINRDCRA